MDASKLRELTDWLIDGGRSAASPSKFMAECCERMVAAGLPLFPASGRPLDERSVESALDLGVCLAAYAVASPHTIPDGVGWARLRSFLAPLGVRFGPALEGLTGVAA